MSHFGGWGFFFFFFSSCICTPNLTPRSGGTSLCALAYDERAGAEGSRISYNYLCRVAIFSFTKFVGINPELRECDLGLFWMGGGQVLACRTTSARHDYHLTKHMEIFLQKDA